jgi:DNA-directed RNA polymerase specialized sigma24 family protein
MAKLSRLPISCRAGGAGRGGTAQARQERGGRDVAFVTLNESVATYSSTPEDVLALDAALDELALVQPRQAQMVECRFFGGLDVAETAKLLQVSEATVLRDWRAVKAWLAMTLRQPR